MPEIDDNLDEVLASYEGELPSEGHELTVANVMEYAKTLHDREGYYVFDDKGLIKHVRRNIVELMDSDQPLSDSNIQSALDKAAFEYVTWLLELVGGLQPALPGDEAPREATRGEWATRTGNLANSFRHQVDGMSVRNPSPDIPRDVVYEPLPFPR